MYVKLSTDWVNLNGLEVTDINRIKQTIVMLSGDEYYLQVRGTKLYGPVGLYIWHGNEPTSSNTEGSSLLVEGQQGYLVKGIDNIYVRGMNGPVELSIRKVQ